MAAGVSGRLGNHAIIRGKGETDHVFAHALIQGPNGTEWNTVIVGVKVKSFFITNGYFS